jgi:glycine reductase complex component B subunit gamma
VLEKEIERAGIPAVLITALVPTAQTLHANRIVPGIGITNPLGDPLLSRVEEKALRKKIVLDALKTLTAPPGETNDSRQGDTLCKN